MIDDLPDNVKQAYIQVRRLPDGRFIGVHKLMFHWTLHVDIDWFGYDEHYCYTTEAGALKALNEWDGTGDPEGWHRHPETSRRRNLETGRQWIEK